MKSHSMRPEVLTPPPGCTSGGKESMKSHSMRPEVLTPPPGCTSAGTSRNEAGLQPAQATFDIETGRGAEVEWYRPTKADISPEEAWRMTVSGLPAGAVPLGQELSEIVDFMPICGGELVPRRSVLLLCELESDREGELLASAGADFYFAVFCNGTTCISTLEHGNGGTPPSPFDIVFKIPLRTGKNLLGFYVQSGMGGWKGGIRFLPKTRENLRRLSRHEMIRTAFPAKNELRCGPWITHAEGHQAVVRFTTGGELAVCVECREKNSGEVRRFYELWNGHLRDDTDRHSLVLTHLQPGREYELRIGLIPKVRSVIPPVHQVVEFLPGKYTFRTPPAPGSPTRIFAVTDTHMPGLSRRKFLENGEKFFGITRGNLMLHLGDMASSITHFDDDVLGGYVEFFNRGGRLTPLATLHGNHEYSGAEHALWNSAFASPSGKDYYAFRSGDCFIAIINYWGCPTAPEEIPSNLRDHDFEQKEWLEKVMDSEDFLSAKYRILCNHCSPEYWAHKSPPIGKDGISGHSGKASWTLMLCGHDHRCFWNRICGVPVIRLGGGETLDELTFAELQTTPEKLDLRIWNGNGKPLFDLAVTPEGNVESKLSGE